MIERCDCWVGKAPCINDAVEVLWFLNPLCAGRPNGRLAICAAHLATMPSIP